VMTNFLGVVLMAAITFPVSFLVARTCLRGLIWIMTYGSEPFASQPGRENRHVLSSQP
jgi:hypothetical protein